MEITYKEARQIIERRKPTNTQHNSYAAAVISKPLTTSISTQTEVTWLEVTPKQIKDANVSQNQNQNANSNTNTNSNTQTESADKVEEIKKKTTKDKKKLNRTGREPKGSQDPVKQAKELVFQGEEDWGDPRDVDMDTNTIPPTPDPTNKGGGHRSKSPVQAP